MKKILILCAILCSLFSLKAQEFNAGILIGASISQVDGDGMGGFHRIAPQGGLFVNRQINKTSAIQGELLYVYKGSAIESSQEPIDNVEILASYVDIALYYKYLFSDKIDFKVGLAPSVLINKKETSNGIEENSPVGFRKLGLLFSIGTEYYFNNFYHFLFDNGQYYNYFKFSFGYRF